MVMTDYSKFNRWVEKIIKITLHDSHKFLFLTLTQMTEESALVLSTTTIMREFVADMTVSLTCVNMQ